MVRFTKLCIDFPTALAVISNDCYGHMQWAVEEVNLVVGPPNLPLRTDHVYGTCKFTEMNPGVSEIQHAL